MAQTILTRLSFLISRSNNLHTHTDLGSQLSLAVDGSSVAECGRLSSAGFWAHYNIAIITYVITY